MRHLKTFNQLNENKLENVKLNDIINNIFDIYPSKELLSDFLQEESLVISHNIYDSLVDSIDVLELPERKLKQFSNNLGVEDDLKSLINILEKLYEEKTTNKFFDDLNKHIKDIEKAYNEIGDDNILNYLKEIRKIKM